ncbi:MAG: DNA mismatch repair protein MutS [Flavobacteriaceae bacterium]|nr:DNA mismatch repair protein MutS [Flavobacteriaceae bacterium]MBT5282499.1 DNA mismatch repair protein MutS [Flavobacteriaceae bacterium]MBT5694094.1 DNA mismatch repair protein MutS [Flavobacteriaceae bacterium]MBT5974421.1 DNA mismatch repair protein MutS [Flavobacteriaceae bacterium]MBT6954516.1 DNA mismatch repair protein MutS [Flavobacteriaceae bacterium]
MLAKAAKETPLMKQYNRIKAKYPDALLLFRVGDFYETFGADAVKAAGILGIILTKRGAGSASEIELAGFPHHSLNTYLPKLVKAGCRVAICDQLEDPKMTKTIVKRGVTELITPGVSLHDDVLDQKKHNYLAAVSFDKKWGVSFLDISTGDFWVAEGTEEQIEQLLQSFAPSEVLVPKPKKKLFLEQYGLQYHCFYMEDWAFELGTAQEKLTTHFQTNSLEGFGVQKYTVGISAAGAVLHYLTQAQHRKLQHITRILPIAQEGFVWLDRFTQRNLELFQSTHPEGIPLISIIDHTQTAMGGRLLRRWLAFPLKEQQQIESRHEIVEAFIEQEEISQYTEQALSNIIDIERVMAKIATEKISPRALYQLQDSLSEVEGLKKQLEKGSNFTIKEQLKTISSCAAIISLIQQTIHPEAPVLVSKGKVIAEGFSSDLDALRGLRDQSQSHLDAMLERETERSQIPSLKIAFNNVFGYYIEVRNTHKDKVPEDWIRKQTLVNAERYITEELKTFETEILQAGDRIMALEQQLYAELIQHLQKDLEVLKQNANAVAQWDVLSCFAKTALKNNYCRPTLTQGTELELRGARHPVIEQQLPLGTPYIANDLELDRETQQIMMITGPNMSGKSAILRQTALISLLAQLGSYVPATQATLGVVDKIFTRVGASDNISMGASTFMVEMNETASILNNISDRSLVLLDEIGRGTSTYDGISIAWAIAEYLHEHPFRPKVLFATHYHELNEMTQRYSRIKNFNVSIKEAKDSVLFLRKLIPGGSAHSFGIHVAKMAGMPQHVLRSAQDKLKVLEASHGLKKSEKAEKDSEENLQLSFFNLDDPLLEALRDEIKSLDIDTLTPVEALMQLNQIKRRLS